MNEEEIDFIPDENQSLFNPQGRAMERLVPRTGARVAETLIGGIGDIPSSIENLLKKGYSKITGEEAPQFSITEDIFNLPTTSKFKKFEKGFLGNYLEPQNRKEEFGDDIVKAATSLMSMKVNPANALKGAALGTGMRYIGKAFKMPDWVQTGLDFMGTAIGSAKFPNLEAYKNQLYSEMETALPKGATTETSKLAKYTDNILEKFGKGSQNIPQKNTVRKIISELNEKAKGGIMEVEDLQEFKKDIYKAIGDYQNTGTYKGILKKVNNQVKNTLYDYGKINPEYVEKLKQADKYFGELSDFSQGTSFLSDLKEAKKFSAALALVEGKFGNLIKILGLSKAGNEIYNLLKHPRIVELYGKSLGAGFKNNKATSMNYLRKLDEELRKIQPEEEIEFIED